ncbi:MAG TPA: phosphoglucosamine mutase [Gammaproteobacteria bacterium]|nr:phosphoglucosamine mutase [Gammaproteobacteria bacterium]
MNKKYFGTDGIRGRVGEGPISPDWFLKLGWAVGKVLSEVAPPGSRTKVLIGKDTRISGYMFESALEAGLVAAGTDVHLLGPMPTPGIAYLTRTLQAGAGIVISASHNQHIDNGIKFFSPDGMKLPDTLEQRIEEYVDRQSMTTVESKMLGRAVRIHDAQGRYIEFCKSTFPHDLNLKGLKIVVDCANGAAYNIAPNVFEELGAEVIAIGVDPDGLNINLACGATNTQALVAKVKEAQADIGIALDGDGDRVICIDHTGSVVDGDELLCIIARWYVHSNKHFGGVAGTLMSNYGLELAFEKMGIPFCRTKVGDRFVLEALRQRNWLLGGESSGHILCLDAHSTGDGIIAALRVLAFMITYGETLYDLKQHMQKLPQLLINVPVRQTVDLEHGQIKQALVDAEKRLANTGRVLLRASGTEPLVRVMAEGMDAELVKSVAQDLAETVSSVACAKS